MQSRMEKYYVDATTSMKRSEKNQKLYHEIYGGDYNLEHLPLSNNINEIDATRLKEIVQKQNPRSSQISSEPITKDTNIKSSTPTDNHSQKVYDINKLLEEAKKENNKIKNIEPSDHLRRQQQYLSTLESQELPVSEVKKACEVYEKKQEEIASQPTISDDNPVEQLFGSTTNLSLDILSDLKSSDESTLSSVDHDIHILKDDLLTNATQPESSSPSEKNNFYTNTYTFSNKDFEEDNEPFFEEPPKSGFFWKISLLVLIILLCFIAVFLFIYYYGIGQ